jgi:hypothetical protein
MLGLGVDLPYELPIRYQEIFILIEPMHEEVELPLIDHESIILHIQESITPYVND